MKSASNFKKPYIIAEIGSNFNQDYKLGCELIHQAKNCGANAVKFQLFKPQKLYPNNKKMLKIFKSIELKQNMFLKFYSFAKRVGIDISASVFDISSAKFLNNLNIKFNKIASSEISNINLLNFLAKTGKPIFLSTGMSNLEDIKQAVNIFEKNKNFNIFILQCGSLYPLKHTKCNLNVLKTFRKNFNFSLGFSDHTLDGTAAIVSTGLGAVVFEKHFTLNKKLIGPDHFYAMEPKEFKSYVKNIKNAFKTLGSDKKNLLPEEKLNSRREGLYYKKDLRKNEILTKNKVVFKSPPKGLTPAYLNGLLSKKLKVNVKKDKPIELKHFK